MPPHLSNITSIPTKFSSFIGATQFEEDEFVWGAMTQLESKVEEADGLVTTRVQERKETAKRTDQKRKWRTRRLVKKGREEQQKCTSQHINKSPGLQTQKCHSKFYNES